MEIQGYGWKATYADGSLDCEFKGAGVLAAGGKTRTFKATDLTGLAFKPAKTLSNGVLTLGTNAGKTDLHFTKKNSEQVTALYEALYNDAPRAQDVTPTGGYQNAMTTALTANEILLPVDYTLWVRGVSYEQATLKRIKHGPYTFELFATEYNEADPTAVEVRLKGKRVGYMPSGEDRTVAMWECAMAARKVGKKLVAKGEVSKNADGLIVVDLDLPGTKAVREIQSTLGV